MNEHVIKKSTLDFLKKLTNNNNREWFAAHKKQYEQAKENVEIFMDALINKMNQHDDIETPNGKKSLFRIYNDVRFSKDKSPYNPRFSGYLRRVKPMLRGGYFITIKPGKTTVRCGFSYPNVEDLKRIREDILLNHKDWNKLLKSKGIKKYFGEMRGEKVMTVPRGYSKDHPALDLLRYKQFLFHRSFTDHEVLAPDFFINVVKTFRGIRPIFNYMSEVLTTNINGEPVN